METVGGYNLVRELGSGDRARVFLGRSATPSLAADALHGTVAVKVFRPDIDLSTIDDEIAALIRTQSKHVVQLLDLSTHLDGAPILILQRLVPGGLSQLLMTRQFVAAGEAVTILAPLAEAIGLAHRVGVAHGAMRVSAVLFDDHWAPVLACFGRARAIVFSRTGPPTPAMIEQSDDMLQDLHGLCAIVLAVLARVGDPAAHSSIQAIKDWLDMSGRQGFPSSFCAELGSRLFDLSDPAPIGVDSARPSPGT
ncbi:MAG: hypothetical protein JWP30_1462, partial [Homoserinimonas sp.]|nr:hypothetical protein [Homoserinimonas sp.]